MIQAVTILMFNPDGSGRVLAISRGEDLDDWGLVGGKVEPNEALTAAIRREVMEEANIAVGDVVPVFAAIARTRFTTTFAPGATFALPPQLPHTREGKVAWKAPWMLCRASSSYHRYNIAMFKRLGVFPC